MPRSVPGRQIAGLPRRSIPAVQLAAANRDWLAAPCGSAHVLRPSWRILLVLSSTPNERASFPPLTRKM
jgi:hypothetical protein